MTNKQEILKYIQKDDTQWYPTTDDAIALICNDIHKNNYIDIIDNIFEPCCGDGRVSKGIKKTLNKHIDMFGIEINEHLRVEARKNGISLVGRNFLNERYFMEDETFMFLNPPFSNWEAFFEKAIIEFNDFNDRTCVGEFKIAYFILPPRALESELFKNMMEKNNIFSSEEIEAKLKKRSSNRYVKKELFSYYEILDFIDFNNSDRSARVKAPLIKIKFKFSTIKKNDIMNFFKFAFNEDIKQYSIQDELDKMFCDVKDNKIKANNILSGSDLIKQMVNLYNYELTKMMLEIKSILQLPEGAKDLLKVDLIAIKNIFKNKEKNLRDDSWQSIFDNLNSIRNKLTTKYRNDLIKNFATKLDFTETNIREIIISSIKYATVLLDKQIAEFYWNIIETILSSKDSYWSNEIYTKNIRKFRYEKNNTDIKLLDYRIIIKSDVFEHHNNSIFINKSNILENFRVSALLLGFSNPYWKFAEKTSETSILCETRNHILNPLKVKDKTLDGTIEDVYKIKGDTEYYQYKINNTWYHSDNIIATKDILITAVIYKKGTMHLKIRQDLLMKMTYLALIDKNIIKNSEEFDIYMNNLQNEENNDIKLSKKEQEAINNIKQKGICPQNIFIKQINNNKLLSI